MGKRALELPARQIPSPRLSVSTRLAMDLAVSLNLSASPSHTRPRPDAFWESRANPRYCATRTCPDEPKASGEQARTGKTMGNVRERGAEAWGTRSHKQVNQARLLRKALYKYSMTSFHGFHKNSFARNVTFSCSQRRGAHRLPCRQNKTRNDSALFRTQAINRVHTQKKEHWIVSNRRLPPCINAITSQSESISWCAAISIIPMRVAALAMTVQAPMLHS